MEYIVQPAWMKKRETGGEERERDISRLIVQAARMKEREEGKERERERECVCVLNSLESHHLLEVSPAKVGKLVSLSGECQHCIWSQPHGSVHARGEVNTKEWKSRIWNLTIARRVVII